eukprot:TRINITY_DN2662_c0_g1_i1.p1 TRINITY_DN2662_c0_g1~~TRINITY_DN2662_c0_g1_i1.p1  ORF type:complete len:1297 (-),score=239.13 TRINITY_DN2662_c0_g1_i1:983-4873(-)
METREQPERSVSVPVTPLSSAQWSTSEDAPSIEYKFRVHYDTAPGQEVRVVGNVPELGSWRVSGALPLHRLSPDKTGSYLWEGTAHVRSKSDHFYYKYVVVSAAAEEEEAADVGDEDSSEAADRVRWEGGADHVGLLLAPDNFTNNNGAVERAVSPAAPTARRGSICAATKAAAEIMRKASLRRAAEIAATEGRTTTDDWRDDLDISKTGGRSYTWGCMRRQASSDTSNAIVPDPVPVTGMETIAVMGVSCGGMQTVLLDDCGVVYNSGGLAPTSNPWPLAELRDRRIISVSCGTLAARAIDSKGAVYEWVFAGGRSSELRRVYLKPPATRAVQVCAGAGFAFVVDDHHCAHAWGINTAGQLGVGDTTDRREPAVVEALHGKVKEVACGLKHTLFRTLDGHIFSCGDNSFGELGLGDRTSRTVPSLVTLLQPATRMACGGSISVILAANGVWVCGRQHVCGLGDNVGADQLVPVLLSCGLLKTEYVSNVACGGAFGRSHTALLTNFGRVFMFGDNEFGQCGVSAAEAPVVRSPTLMEQLAGEFISGVACGWHHTAAITKFVGRIPFLVGAAGAFGPLPTTLIRAVMAHLDERSLVALARTNSLLSQLVDTEDVWMTQCMRAGLPLMPEGHWDEDTLRAFPPFDCYPVWKLYYLRLLYPHFFLKKEEEILGAVEAANNVSYFKNWTEVAGSEAGPWPSVRAFIQSPSSAALRQSSGFLGARQGRLNEYFAVPPHLEALTEESPVMRLHKVGEWYKDAVFYEVFVRAFCDSNGDGIGDFTGLRTKLGYLHDLGVTALWLLPITQSPLRDHGYDVSDYYATHPDYGTLQDLRELVTDAHHLGLSIVIELVPNHTSSDHAWFKASADPQHPAHDAYRNYYMWSDTDKLFSLARIIFRDYEASNWTFDPRRMAYYYHRFFYHQPDLNYDNPDVQAAMLDVVRFWIDQGVDGIRVDAPPYLFKREGTNCENLPETHAFFKSLKKFVHSYAPDVMLLSEANQWPEEVAKYFGKGGDEFDMNFHFPLMPRIYLSIAQASRASIDDILARTPSLPAQCQWGTFLRNHDELTLEMVTEEERQFMWEYYAPDPRMRLNLGIRRRLAPLLNNNTACIILAHSILLTIIGSPFLYYGDEICMGDDILLDDRSGVRTPMQWHSGPGAGFSQADPSKFFLPLLSSELYSYKRINVETQSADHKSLFNWLKRALRVRGKHPAFGRGDLQLLDTPNESVLAYARHYEGETVVVVNNLSCRRESVDLPAIVFGDVKPSKVLDILYKQKVVCSTDRLRLNLKPWGVAWLGTKHAV